MNSIAINVISALAISGVISLMAALRGAKAKSLVYSLPIPITVALLATGSNINGFTFFGIVLANLFLWGTFYLFEVRKWPLLLTDALLALTYILVGYVLLRVTVIPLVPSLIAFPALWLTFMIATAKQVAVKEVTQPSAMPIWSKALGVFILAYLLFTAKDYLSGFITLFPFSGVFAVYEGKNLLRTMALVFSRNSIAIWAFLATDHFLMPTTGKWYSLIAGWIVYVAVLLAATKVFPLAKQLS